jgi:hypothetical protein
MEVRFEATCWLKARYPGKKKRGLGRGLGRGSTKATVVSRYVEKIATLMTGS